MDLSALESSVKALETSLDSVEGWITISTVLVVIGLVIEYWFPLRELIAEMRNKLFPWKLLAEMVGGVLVTVGVAGELWFQSRASSLQTFIRSDSHQIEALLNKEADDARRDAGNANKDAGDAKERAGKLEVQAATLRKQAEDEHTARVELEDKVAWRTFSREQQADIKSKLSRFAGQFAQFQFLSSDMEAFSFSSEMSAVLRATQWRVIPPSPNLLYMKEVDMRGRNTVSPIETIDFGVELVSTPDATDAAFAIIDELHHLGFDAHFRPSTERPQPVPTVWVSVEHKPLGPQGEAKLRAEKTKERP